MVLIFIEVTSPRLIATNIIQFQSSVFAQAINNASTVVFPSQNGSLEITFNNAPSSDPDYSIYIQILTAISSAAAAIAGGYLASRYTHKQAMDVERLRHNQQKQKEDALEAKQKKLKDEYRDKIISVVYDELSGFSYRLGVMEESKFIKSREDMQVLAALFESFRMEYLQIPFDTRLTLFTPKVLYSVETAYINFEAFRKGFSLLVKTNLSYDLEEEYKKLRPNIVKEIIDVAISKLKDLVPDIV